MTLQIPTKDDMLKKKAMYKKAINDLPKPLFEELIEAYGLYKYGLDGQKKVAIKNINETFKVKEEEAYKKADKLFWEAWQQSGLKGDCEISNGFKRRLEQKLRKIIEAL